MYTAQVQLDFTEGQTCSLWYWPIQSTDNFVRKDCQIWWPSIKFLTALSGLTFSTSVSAVSLRASLWSSELTYFNCHLRWSQLKFPSTVWRKAQLYEFQMLKNYKAIILMSIIVEKIGDSSFVSGKQRGAGEIFDSWFLKVWSWLCGNCCSRCLSPLKIYYPTSTAWTQHKAPAVNVEDRWFQRLGNIELTHLQH